MKNKYCEDDLHDFIDEVTTCEMTCNNCKDTKEFYGDTYSTISRFFDAGWRVTKSEKVYCPACAAKKLKQ